MQRSEQRARDQLRRVKFTKHYLKHAEGSCLITCGETRVVCSASVEEGVPPFLKGKGTGWVTAEYGMLPRSCTTRIRRERALNSGRTQEIQRLIGRSLRSVVDLEALGERTIKMDCDVLQADGGTRTASITGGFVALALALKRLKKTKVLPGIPLRGQVAAVSVGICDGQPVLDLDYREDANADMDMNVVMLSSGDLVEVQGTAEGAPFSRRQFNKLLDLAQKGIGELLTAQKKTLGAF